MTTKIITDRDWLIAEALHAEGAPYIHFNPGIGESGQRLLPPRYVYGAKGSEAATQEVLNRVSNWCGGNGLVAAGDKFNFNVTTLSAKDEYNDGELPTVFDYIKSKGQKVKALLNSLGGFGFFKQVGLNAALLNNVEVIVSLVSGPGYHPDTAKHIAAAKIPCLLITTENDTHSGTNPQFTINLHKAIIAAGGISYLAVFKTGAFDDPHNGPYFGLIPAWTVPAMNKYPLTATPLGEAGIKNILDKFPCTLYEFALNKGMPVTDQKPLETKPDPVVTQPTPKPNPQPQPAPTPKPNPPSKPTEAITAVIKSHDLLPDPKTPGGGVLLVNWSAGIPSRYPFLWKDLREFYVGYDTRTLSLHFNNGTPSIILNKKSVTK